MSEGVTKEHGYIPCTLFMSFKLSCMKLPFPTIRWPM